MRPRRPAYFQGGCYHIYNRGAHGETVFREQENYLFVLEKLQKYRREFSLCILAYCLMPNHYHFLVRQDGHHAAGLLPQRVFNSYTKACNKRYQHSGTLFEGPYRLIHVDRHEYLLHLCRYIHANPVLHGYIAALEDWPYSNYSEWVGLRGGTLIDYPFVQEHFPEPTGYTAFVLDYLKTRQLPDEVEAYLDEFEV